MTRLRVVFLITVFGFAIIFLASLLYVGQKRKSASRTPDGEVVQPRPNPTQAAVFERAKSQPWSVATQQISAQITAVDKTKSSLLLTISWPPSAPIHGKTIWVKIACPAEEIKIEKSDSKDLFGQAGKNDYFYGYCDDGNCQSISRGCDLQKYAR